VSSSALSYQLASCTLDCLWELKGSARKGLRAFRIGSSLVWRTRTLLTNADFFCRDFNGRTPEAHSGEQSRHVRRRECVGSASRGERANGAVT
jgi:hypothetical protein